MTSYFRGIDRDPFELVRYAKSECQAWYNVKDTISDPKREQIIDETQVLNLGNCNTRIFQNK